MTLTSHTCPNCGETIKDPDAGCPCTDQFDKKKFFCFECGKETVRTSPSQRYCRKCIKIRQKRQSDESHAKEKDRKIKRFAILICDCGFKYKINYDIKENLNRFRAEKCPKCGKERFPKVELEESFNGRWVKCKKCDRRAAGGGLCQSHYAKKRWADSHKKTVKIIVKK